MTSDDLDILIILPYTTPEFEANIWGAVIDSFRDWNETEKEYLRRNQGLRESIIDWCAFMNQSSCTDANLFFLRPYWKAEATTDDLAGPGDGSSQNDRQKQSSRN